jgi:aspartyl-tRNA(Asn)/glutamyl-tRNA(Gln) amidotransferase subunit B
MVSDIAGWYAKNGNDEEAEYADISPDGFATLIQMISKGELSSRGAKDTLVVFLTEKGDPKAIATERGFMQVSDTDAIRTAVRAVIAEHSTIAEEYKGGKETALQFLIGQTMKAMKGAGNPGVIKDLILSELA